MSQKMNEVKEWLEKAEQDLVARLIGRNFAWHTEIKTLSFYGVKQVDDARLRDAIMS